MMKVRAKVVVVTRKTELEGLVERFNTRDQARVYIEHMGGWFGLYESAHETYKAAVQALEQAIPRGVRSQWIERSFLPTYTFGPNDLVVTLGPDGLVVNTAKYLDGQPLLALNPDPDTIDGILIPFSISEAPEVLPEALAGAMPSRSITMARATLNDGRSILAVNDLFLGQKTHQSARYALNCAQGRERQSSSGIIVSTGAGSTGWRRSVLAGAAGVMRAQGAASNVAGAAGRYQFDAESEVLIFHVREPFESQTSSARIVQGEITRLSPLTVISQMPQNGVIFSDGIEEDFLEFNSGSTATVAIADRKLILLDRLEAKKPRSGARFAPHRARV